MSKVNKIRISYGKPLGQKEKDELTAYYDCVAEDMKTVRTELLNMIDSLVSVYTSSSSEKLYSKLKNFVDLYTEYFGGYIQKLYDDYREECCVHSSNDADNEFYNELERVEYDAVSQLFIDHIDLPAAEDGDLQVCLTEDDELRGKIGVVIDAFKDKMRALLDKYEQDANEEVPGTEDPVISILEEYCALVNVDEDLSLVYSVGFYDYCESENYRRANPQDFE